MKEKALQTIFNSWLKEVYRGTGAFELKVAKGDSLPFSAVKPHQIQGLYAAKHRGLVFKIPDMGYQVPFDCFSLVGVPAFVVIKFKDGVYLIDIDDFIQEIHNSKRKSLTQRRAKQIYTRQM